MSNTASVSPYASTSAEPGVAVASLAGAAALGAWLTSEDDEDRLAKERLAAARRRELTDTSRVLSIPVNRVSVSLHAAELSPVVEAAKQLGYHVLRPRVSEHLSNQVVALRGEGGERIAVERTPEGTLTLHTVGDRQRLHAIVRQHTTDRVRLHLLERGLAVRMERLSNGETEIVGSGPTQSADGAKVTAKVRRDGTAELDIEHVRGRRCEQIVNDLACAVGGTITNLRLKSSYYQLPGEPAKLKI